MKTPPKTISREKEGEKGFQRTAAGTGGKYRCNLLYQREFKTCFKIDIKTVFMILAFIISCNVDAAERAYFDNLYLFEKARYQNISNEYSKSHFSDMNKIFGTNRLNGSISAKDTIWDLLEQA
jgi:hypothetical protein